MGWKRGIRIAQDYLDTFPKARAKSGALGAARGTQQLNPTTVKPPALWFDQIRSRVFFYVGAGEMSHNLEKDRNRAVYFPAHCKWQLERPRAEQLLTSNAREIQGYDSFYWFQGF